MYKRYDVLFILAIPELIKAMTSGTFCGSLVKAGEINAFSGLEAVVLRSSEISCPIPTTIILPTPDFLICSAGTVISSVDSPPNMMTNIYKNGI